MKVFAALLIIIFLAFSGYHLTFRSLRVPLFVRKFYLTGIEFLFLGLLLGPQFLNLLDEETCKGLEPMSALLLGLIGLLFGFQFELSKLRRYPFGFLAAAFLEGFVTIALVFIGLYFTLPLFVNINAEMQMIAVITLAAAAACTAQTGLALQAPDTITSHRNTLKLLRYISSMDGFCGLILFAGLFFLRPSLNTGLQSARETGQGALIIMAACFGLLLLYILFLVQRRKGNELVMVVIGMTVLASGAALLMNFSPLLINCFVGFCLVNLTREKERIYDILIRIEKPVYLLLLVFLGAGFRPDSVNLFILAACYSLYRFSGKLISGFLVIQMSKGMKTHSRLLGLGLLEQGGLALAILYDFQQGFSGEAVSFVISLALLSIIYNDLLSPHLLKLALKPEQSDDA
jgi:hypothetical protein